MVWQVLALTEHGSNVLSSWRLLPDGFAVFRVELELVDSKMVDIDSVKSTGVLSESGLLSRTLSDTNMDKHATQRQSMEAPVCTAKR